MSSKKIPSKSSRAFSLIELSMVILIIGILISGILFFNKIISKFRISTAQTLTISSPVSGIPDSMLWLESSLEKSFKSNEQTDTNSLSAWYDIRENANKNHAVQSSSVNYPVYSNTINYIHAVRFDGTNSYLNIADASFLNNSDYTIFILEQRESNKANNYFIGDSSSANESTTNQNLTLGYSADDTIKHSHSSDNKYTGSVTTYDQSRDKPRIFAFTHSKTTGKKTYVNGLLAASSSDTTSLTNMTSLKIGKSYQGQLGEVIIFARSLNNEERQSVEDYLGKKWSSPILRTSNASGSCSGGIVSNTGCQMACNVPATAGITSTVVADGTGSLSCNTSANFAAGSLAYSCSGGTFQYTGASSSCSCTTGYSWNGSACVTSTCTFSGTTGIADGTTVNYTTTGVSRTCDTTGSITYTCAGGGVAPVITSGSCSAPSCTGGTITTYSSGGTSYKVHTFTSSGVLNCPSAKTASILLVAGGGASGMNGWMNQGGGGGGGGVIYLSSYSLNTTDYTITVGAGGSVGASVSVPGGNGGDSILAQSGSNLYTAIGGGGGGSASANAANGGSGGGKSSNASLAGTGTSGQGNNGGVTSASGSAASGGGGGAGGAGGNTVTGTPYHGAGSGGIGLGYDISGTLTYYGGGGFGGCFKTSCDYTASPTAAAGGGGIPGTSGTDGRGGGGGGFCTETNSTKCGGGYTYGSAGYKGGSGVVLVRYPN